MTAEGMRMRNGRGNEIQELAISEGLTKHAQIAGMADCCRAAACLMTPSNAAPSCLLLVFVVNQ